MCTPSPRINHRLSTVSRSFVLALAGLTAGMQPSAASQDDWGIEINGAMAQGYAYSWGNQIFGSSLDGSNQLSEVAITGRKVLFPRVLASGQLMARRAGQTSDGRMQVDYAQLDLLAISRLDSHLGLRIGKLKNAYGFFNSSRDVVFSRGAVTLPSSVYYDGTGFRDFFFSTEGVQLYGDHLFGNSLGEFTLGWARKYDATDEFRSALNFEDWNGHIQVHDFWTAQWLHEWFDGRLRTGVSYLGVALDYINHDPESAIPDIYQESDLYVLSVQWQTQTLTLTSEARFNESSTRYDDTRLRSQGDGIYAQIRYRGSPQWSTYLRYDVLYPNRDDRSGRALAERGEPAHGAFGRDLTLGWEWRPAFQWGVFGEYHWINGTAAASQTDNGSRELDKHWQALLLMIGYRF